MRYTTKLVLPFLAFMASWNAGVSTAYSATPFQQFSGSWKGAGQIRLTNGERERLSCRGYYNTKSGGDVLTLAIRCASPSYKIEMRSTLNHRSGRVSGRWEERTFNVEGNVGGSATNDRLNLSFSGAISGSMSVAVSGSSQRVNIATSGPGFRDVSINFSRS